LTTPQTEISQVLENKAVVRDQHEWRLPMKEFMEFVIKHLVDEPADVHVDEIIGEHTVIYELHVGADDMGKVIGKHGQTANSLRTILAVAAAKEGKRCVMEIVEVNRTRRMTSHNNSQATPVAT
jgi:predicted RNA-binding protein YlqC (UPF0109 family)